MKHVTALPKLRILKIQRIDSEIDDEVTWKTFQNLVSLELKKVSETFVKKILRCCPEGLTDLLVCSLRDSTDIQFMMDKLPNLKTVGFHHCTFAEDKLSLFLAKFARQVQYLYFNSANFKSVHLDQLTNLASPSLQAFDHDKEGNTQVPGVFRGCCLEKLSFSLCVCLWKSKSEEASSFLQRTPDDMVRKAI